MHCCCCCCNNNNAIITNSSRSCLLRSIAWHPVDQCRVLSAESYKAIVLHLCKQLAQTRNYSSAGRRLEPPFSDMQCMGPLV